MRPFFSSISALLEFLNFQTQSAGCFMQLGGNDLFPAKPEKGTMGILSYVQYLKDGIGIRHVVIGQLLGRLTLTSYPSIV